MVSMSVIFLVIAVIIFLLGGWSRWWPAAVGTPYYPAFVCMGLFFWALSQLWSLVSK